MGERQQCEHSGLVEDCEIAVCQGKTIGQLWAPIAERVGRDSWKEAPSTEQWKVGVGTPRSLQSVLLNWFGLLTRAKLVYRYHNLSYIYRGSHKRLRKRVLFFKIIFQISTTVWFRQSISECFAGSVHSKRDFCDLLLNTTSWTIFHPPAWSQGSKSTTPTIWFMNQFEYRMQQLVMHVDFLRGTISN